MCSGLPQGPLTRPTRYKCLGARPLVRALEYIHVSAHVWVRSGRETTSEVRPPPFHTRPSYSAATLLPAGEKKQRGTAGRELQDEERNSWGVEEMKAV